MTNNKTANKIKMKNLLVYLIALTTTTLSAQDAKYVSAMEKVIHQIDSAKSPADFQNANNQLERIGNANQTEWLPLYYQSFCNLMIGMKQENPSQKDDYFNKAETLINKADSLSPKNSEIYVMKSFVYSMMISVDPANRGRKYGPLSGEMTSKAIEYDKENPRAYFMKGQGVLYTPAQWGGGAERALPVLEEAVAKFKTFKPSSSIMPAWGEAKANEALEHCKTLLKDAK
jgi:hypothetical protein